MLVGGRTKAMDIRVRRVAGYTVLEAAGELDMYTAPTLREHLLDQSRAGHHHLIIDMTEVMFMDSSGLGVLVGGSKRARAAGTVSIAGASGQILGTLRITGLSKVFPVFATVAEALPAAAQ